VVIPGRQAQGNDDHSTDDGQEDHLLHLVHMHAGEWATLSVTPNLVLFGTHAGPLRRRGHIRRSGLASRRWGVRRIFRFGSYRPILGLWVRLPGYASGTTGPAGS
jgi:hypothetical protein